MPMPILKRKSPKSEGGKAGARKFIDLNDYKFPELKDDSNGTVRVAEVSRFEDIRKIASLIYEGNIMIIDCSPVSREEYLMARVKEELKRIVRDMNGDVAGVGSSGTYFVVTPPGINIDRQRIRAF